MTRTFMLPDLGEGLTEADLIRWTVAEGDRVEIDQVVAEVETAKSAVEVPCPWAGTVVTLHGRPGEVMAVDSPLITIDTGEDGPAPGAAASDDAAAGPERAQSYREEERAGAVPAEQEDPAEDEGSGNVLIGYGTPGGGATGRTRRRKNAAASVSPAAPAGPAVHEPVWQAPRVVNPLVRRLAREHGVDLTAVRGTGPGGLVMRADVLSSAGAAAPPAVPAGKGGAAGTSWAPEPTDALDPRTGLTVAGVEKVSGVRKVTAAAMTRSRQEIPEATIWVDVDVTPMLQARAQMKARGDGQVPGLLAFASRFALAGLTRFPELAMRFEEDGSGGHRIVSFDGINLGFAVQSERGLVVPSIRGAHRMSARELDGELRRLTELARSGKGTPQDLSGGTFTINNYGIFGTDGSAAIINHPEVAILGMGRIIDRPWVVDGELAVRKVMQLSLVFDHRICDGGTAGGFLRFVADCFEDPVGLLADA